MFINKTSNAAELYLDDTLQFAYETIDTYGMMEFTPGEKSRSICIYESCFNIIQHTYVLVAKEFSKVLVFTNNASVQQINADPLDTYALLSKHFDEKVARIIAVEDVLMQ